MPADAKKGAVLTMLKVFSVVTIVMLIGVIIAQALICWLVKDLSNSAIAIRAYTIGLALILIFAELDWADTIAKFAVLARWVWRGLALTFVGLLTLEFSGDRTEGKTAAYFVKAIAWITIGLGVIYFLMGLTRVNKLKEKKQAAYETKLAEPAPAAAAPEAAPASAV